MHFQWSRVVLRAEGQGDCMTLKINNLTFMNRGPFNFEVSPGECLGLKGPSGSGKTLLLRSICDIHPWDGAISLGSISAVSVSGPEWRAMVGMLPAESQWWYDTVRLHFSHPVDEDYLHELGFDASVMNWEIARLSAGEKQRLAILRLLSIHPKALLLDEPTAHLDVTRIESVERVINHYRQSTNVPVLWVSHHKDQLQRIASRCLMLEENRLVESVKVGT